MRPLVEDVAGGDWGWFFEDAIAGTLDLNYAPGLTAVGLAVEWRPDPKASQAWLGLRVRTESGRLKIATVLADGPAWGSGLSAGDELLAIDGFRVEESSLDDRLRDYKAEDAVRLAVFRRDELIEIPLTLGGRPPTRASVRKAKRASVRQREQYESWLGAPW
jgi:predicted metalloprotease with PDZ domain